MAARKDILEKVKKSRQQAEQRVQENNRKAMESAQKSGTSYSPSATTVNEYRNKRQQATKWYKGSEPTETETLARIMKLGDIDNEKGSAAYDLYAKSKEQGHWKETYDKATSPYAQALGVDPAQINDAFFEANAGLLAAGVHTSTGGLSSAKKNGSDALLAYNLSGLYEDFQATKELQAEQDLIVREATYWMNKGLSDDEIKQKLAIGSGGKYSKINSAIERSRAGEFTPTTAPIWAATSWGVDGMLWSIRNPEQSTGDYFTDAIQKDMGRGKPSRVVTSDEIARRTPGNAAWAPYSNGTTLDSEAILFGVQQFDDAWIAANRERILSSGTDAEKKAFAKVVAAEENTKLAEKQAANLREEIISGIALGRSPDELFYDGLLDADGYSALAAMQQGVFTGQPVGITRSVDFDMNSLRKEADDLYALHQAQENASKNPEAMNTAVEAEKQAIVAQNGMLISSDTTPKSLTATVPTIYDEDPQKAFKDGIVWASAGKTSGVYEADPTAYGYWTDAQKMAAQTYLTDLKDGTDTSYAIEEMKMAGLSDEQIEYWKNLNSPKETYPAAEIETAIDEGELAAAAEMQEANLKAKIEENPELISSDNAQKAAVLATVLLAESGMTDDPDIIAKGKEYAEIASQASDISSDAGGLYQWLDNAFGGAISQTSDNEGVGLWETLKYATMSGAAKMYDVAAGVAGWGMKMYGEAVRLSNDLLNAVGFDVSDVMADKISDAGDKVSNAFQSNIDRYEAYLRENASTAEYFVANAVSEIMKQFGMGALSKAIGAASAAGKVTDAGAILGKGFNRSLKTALDASRVENMLKLTYSTPFAVEAAVGEAEEAYKKTDNVLTSTLIGLVASGVTLSTMDMGGFLKSIELKGRDILPEVMDSLSSVPGSGVMAHFLRGGKARLMWLGNVLANSTNEGMQEAIEKVLTDAATASLKGEDFLDQDFGAYSGQLFAESAMAFLSNLGNTAGTFSPYSRTIKVIEAQERKSDFTPDDAADLTKAFIADLGDPQVMEDAKQRAHNLAVEVRTGELMAEGALPDVDTGFVEKAQEKAADTAKALQKATEEAAAANERFLENPADTQAASEAKIALQKKNAAEQANIKAQEALKKEESAIQEQQSAAVETVRAQARAEVEQRTQDIRKFNYSDVDTEANIQAVSEMESVASVDIDSFSMAGGDLRNEVSAYFESIGGVVRNPVLGEVALKKSGVKSSIAHGMGPQKAAAFAAVPAVLEKGQVIDLQSNWKQRGYDTFVVAAPITIHEGDADNGYMCGVVVKRAAETQQYYVHEVILEDAKKEPSASFSPGVQTGEPSVAPGDATALQPTVQTDEPSVALGGGKAPSVNSLLEKVRNVKRGNGGSAPPTDNVIPSNGADTASGTGERQFAGQTMQNSPAVPDWIKQEFMRPGELNYDVDSNREQVERSWQRIQQNGYEQERERLLSLDRYSADDTAEANLMMAMALREETSDPETFMALASHYNKEGTKAGQELQARKLFTRMSPTGARVWAAGKMETALEDHMRTHAPQKQKVDRQATHVASTIRNLTAGEGDGEINQRWGVPVNEQQQALIDHYKLSNVARPGLFYNRATTKQRMLEAILATPNPLEATGLGLNLVQRLEYLNAGEAVITNADLDYIGTQMAEFVARGGESGGRDADLAVARAYEAYGNIAPATAGQKTRTWRYVAMLTSFTSAERNVIGNAAQNIVNAATHGLAVEIDRAISKKTGQRTVEHLSMQERAQGWRAFADETKNTFLDYFVDKTTTQKGNAKYDTNQRGRVYQTQAIEAIRNVEGFLMSFGDRNFWKKAYINSLAEQQKLADRGLLYNADGTTRTYEQMVEQAEQDANYATFTEDNRVSEVLTQLKDVPVLGPIVDFIMPFTGVPSNITRRMIEYSPVSLVKGAYRYAMWKQSGKNFDQQAFVNDIARGLTGTAMFGVGALLANMGVIKIGTGEEEDKKKYGLQTAMGQQYTPHIYNPLTDEYVSLAAFSPAASALTMGAAAWSEFKDDETVMQSLMNAAFGSIDQIFDASYMSGLNDLFGGYGGSFGENLRDTLLDNMISQSVPALLGQLASALDPYVRDTKDKNSIMQSIKSGVINKIPFLRQAMLPMKVDVTGQPVRTKEGWRNFVDPFTTTDAREDPVVDELFRLNEALGASNMFPSDVLSGTKDTLTINGKKVAVDDAGKEAYKLRYGELWMDGGKTLDKKGKETRIDGVRFLMKTSRYQRMTDEEKAKAIADILSAAKTGASMEALQKYGETTEKE